MRYRLAAIAILMSVAPAMALSAPRAKRRASTPAAAARGKPAGGKPLALLLEQRKYDEGLKWLSAFGKGGAEEDRYRGLFHHGLAQPGPALQYLLPVYRANPGDDTVALALAETSLWKKDYKTATTVLGQLQSAEAPEALRVRALLFEQAGRLPEALNLYDRAIPQLKQPWGAMERKAQVQSWLKRFDEAGATYAKVIGSRQASLGLRQRCRVRQAELTAWKKDLDGALGQLAVLLKEDPRLTDALLLNGQILEWKGDFAGAKQSYSRILAVDATHAEARLRLDKLLWVK
jgi:tetratricopeptide (TPR) repeat protein